jgi:hypothetical protein
MNEQGLRDLCLAKEGIRVDTSVDQGGLRAVFAGVAGLAIRAELHRLLGALHDAALSLGNREVVADLSRLEFMNASCFREFVGWVNQVQNLTAADQYRIRFRLSPGHPWQQRSIQALKCFATELISIERAEEVATE